jgi:hypothetical protein
MPGPRYLRDRTLSRARQRRYQLFFVCSHVNSTTSHFAYPVGYAPSCRGESCPPSGLCPFALKLTGVIQFYRA